VKLQVMSDTILTSTTVDLFTQHLQLDGRGTIRPDARRMAGDVDADWRLALSMWRPPTMSTPISGKCTPLQMRLCAA
jgi:hypothetical protein